MSYIHGIDVASYQGAHPSLKGSSFVCIKVTQGTTYVSPTWRSQLADARAAGLLVLFSHFPEAGDSIASQVSYMRSTIGSQLAPGDILQLDWETDPATGSAPSGAQKDQFLTAMRAAFPGHRVVLYCNRDFWLNRDTTSDCGDGLWIADPSAPAGKPSVEHPWLIHQYSISGNVDQDVANFSTLAAMRSWALGSTTTTTTPTETFMSALSDAEQTTLAADVTAIRAAVTGHGIASAGYRLLDKDGKSAEPGGVADVHQVWADAATGVTEIKQQLATLATPQVDATALVAAMATNAAFVTAIATQAATQVVEQLAKRLAS